MSKKREWELTPKQQKIFENLWRQVEKHFDFNTHQQGYRGTERYREGLRSFSKHLAIQYQSQNFRNISDQHLKSFVQASAEAGVSASTIGTDLSAIRKLHAKVEKTRHELSVNKQIFKEVGYEGKRQRRGIDRAWRDHEVQKALNLAESTRRQDVKWALSSARTMGLRIEETTGLRKSQLKVALEKGYLHVKGKGGIERDIPLNPEATALFREMLEKAENERIFVKHGQTHHQTFKSIQNWIGNHRDNFQEQYIPDPTYEDQFQIDQRPNLTYHGLRHSYARQQYEKYLEQGYSELEARKMTAELLGHGRDEVTKVYLG